MFSNAAFAGAAAVDVSTLLTQIYLSSRWKTEDAERLESPKTVFFPELKLFWALENPAASLSCNSLS